MKRSHIIAIVIIAVAIGALVSSLYDSSTFVSLEEAMANPGREYSVVGVLDRTQEVVYEPVQDPNLTIFVMQDMEGNSCRVRLNKAKPQDFERSESIVLKGRANAEGEFEAHHILMKCPSKYNEGGLVEG